MTQKHLLIVKHGALGDVVRTSYFARALKEQYGDSLRLSWLTAPAAAPLLRFNPHVDDLWTSFAEAQPFAYDRIYSLDDERPVLEGVTALRSERIVGAFLGTGGEPSYSEDSAEWFDMGLLSRFGKNRADQLKSLNQKTHAQIFCAIFGVEKIAPEFYGSSLMERWRDPWTIDGVVNIGINPLAGDRWPSKALVDAELQSTIRGITRLFDELSLPFRIVLTGSAPEMESNARTAAAVGDPRVCVSDTSDSVLRFAALIKRFAYLITSDSLAMHLAIAQRIPFLAFFSPTPAAEIDDFGIGRKVCSLASDYCSFRKDCDNSTISADRLLGALMDHATSLRKLQPLTLYRSEPKGTSASEAAV